MPSQGPFNPRAREGRDEEAAAAMDVLTTFNPRAREGRDQETQREKIDIKLSIHAPARGATTGCPSCAIFFSTFNPRAREGRDICRFNIKHIQRSFNPRAREGRDYSNW